MKTRQFVASIVALIIASSALLMPSRASSLAVAPFAAPTPNHSRVAGGLQSQAVMFIENVGQFAEDTYFRMHSGDHTIRLVEDTIWMTVLEHPHPSPSPSDSNHSSPLSQYGGGRGESRDTRGESLSGVNLRLSFPGANPHPHMEPFNRLDTSVSYFVGNDPAKWRADVPAWGGVRYVDLYPDVDLEISSEAGHWTWRLVNRNPTSAFHISDVRLRVEGANTLTLDGDRLRLITSVGEFTLPLLRLAGGTEANQVYPTIVGDQIISPFITSASNSHSAVASPQADASDLLYSTFLGGSSSNYGSSWDQSYGIAVDASGAAYITGETNSWDFPTRPGAFQTALRGTSDTFVVKLNATGSGLAYATFLGGVYDEDGYDIAVDGDGAAYITGWTNSPDFPTTPGAFDTSYNGNWDAFVVKLNSTGSALAYGTFLGGNYTEVGRGIAVDGNRTVSLTGWTDSSNFPTTPGAFDRTCGTDGNCNADDSPFGYEDAFVVKLNATGSALTYATFLGGGDNDVGLDLAVDGNGAAYLTGWTQSSNFPTTPGAFDRTCGVDGNCNYRHRDVFVAKLNPMGSALTYATFLGGGESETGLGIAVDGNEAAYVTGWTQASDFPTTPGAFDTSYGGGTCGSYTNPPRYPCYDAFVAKLNATGSALTYATFLGADSDDYGNDIAIDRNGAACVTGETNSSSFPTTPHAFDTSFNGSSQLLCMNGQPCPDAFVVKLSSTGSTLSYGTFLGGLPEEWGEGIVVDENGAAYVTGSTDSSNFPTTPGAFDASFNGGYDAFVAKLSLAGEPTGHKIYLPLILRNR